MVEGQQFIQAEDIQVYADSQLTLPLPWLESSDFYGLGILILLLIFVFLILWLKRMRLERIWWRYQLQHQRLCLRSWARQRLKKNQPAHVLLTLQTLAYAKPDAVPLHEILRVIDDVV